MVGTDVSRFLASAPRDLATSLLLPEREVWHPVLILFEVVTRVATAAEEVADPAKGPLCLAEFLGRPLSKSTTYNRLASYIFIWASTEPFTVFVLTVRIVGRNASRWTAGCPLGDPGTGPAEVLVEGTANVRVPYIIDIWPRVDTRRGVANPVRGSVYPMTVAGMAPDSGGPEGWTWLDTLVVQFVPTGFPPIDTRGDPCVEEEARRGAVLLGPAFFAGKFYLVFSGFLPPVFCFTNIS